MLKKLLLVVVVAVILGVIFLPEITYVAAKSALDPANRGKPWAPDLAWRAAVINLRMMRHARAGGMFSAAYQAWPTAAWRAECHYDIALCYEKIDDTANAIKWYQSFVAAYPNHRWAEQAKKRVSLLQAQH